MVAWYLIKDYKEQYLGILSRTTWDGSWVSYQGLHGMVRSWVSYQGLHGMVARCPIKNYTG